MAFLRAFIKCSGSKNQRFILGRLQDFGKVNSVALKSTAAGAIVQETSPSTVSTPRKDPLDITFENAEAAFKSKTFMELIRAYFVYTVCSSETMVENNMKVRIRNIRQV